MLLNMYSIGIEGLCILLRRLAYPNRLFDLVTLFGLSIPYLSVIVNEVMKIIFNNKGHLLKELKSLFWLNEDNLKYYSKVLIFINFQLYVIILITYVLFYFKAVHYKNSPLKNCWAFIDGTARQRYFSGHKRYHCLKYQSIATPDGLIVNLQGPYIGRRHDAGKF